MLLRFGAKVLFMGHGNAKCYGLFGRECYSFFLIFRKLSILSPYDPEIILLRIYPKELKIYFCTKTCTWVFVASLFIIVNTWKRPGCSSVDERVNKLWYIQTTECQHEMNYEAMKRHGWILNAYY